METARLAWGEPNPDARLRELDFGVWEGFSYDSVDPEVRTVFHRFRGFDIEGGDSYDHFRGRVLSFVADLNGGRHLLFVHGGVIRVLTQDLGLDRFVGTGAVVVVDWSGGRLVSVQEPSAPPTFQR
jgi:probable phosphoglycerate mutase